MTKRALEHQVAHLQQELRKAQAKILALEIQSAVLNAHIDGLLAAVQPILR